MNFTSRFTRNLSNIRVMEVNEYSEKRPKQEKSFKLSDIPLAIFHLTENGPSVLYRDFDKLRGSDLAKTELTNRINNLAANLIAATGSGHTYSEGCFDIKLDNYSKYRLFVTAIKRPRLKNLDPRLKTGYYQIVLFIPLDLALTLPSISKMESHLYNIVSMEIKNSADFKPERIEKLKQKMIEKILTFRN